MGVCTSSRRGENDKSHHKPRHLHRGELEQALAYLLAHAPGGVLNDAEVEKFWLIHKEIQPPEESGNKYRLQGSYS